jgi:hypothetical protein
MYGADAEFSKRLKGFEPRPPDLAAEPSMRNMEPDNARDRVQTRANPPRRNGKQPETVDIGPFFQMPYRLFSSGMGAKLRPSEGWLYAALCSQANDNLSVSFSVSSKALASDTGISPKKIGEAKRRLRELGLIDYSSKPGSKDQYTLMKPELDRIKRKERPRAKLKPRGKAKMGQDSWDGLPQILRGTGANYAREYRKFCAPV